MRQGFARATLEASCEVKLLSEQHALLNIIPEAFECPGARRPKAEDLGHPPRVLLLYGSLRQRSYSRFLTMEAARLCEAMGAQARIFDPSGLPLPDGAPESHPKVKELRALADWAEAQVWCSPERHGAMTAVMKAQIDWIPLEAGSFRPTQNKPLAVLQVCGGEQSFNAVNQLRLLGRSMRMIVIPAQASLPKASSHFDENGHMLASSHYDRLVDVMEELIKITCLTRGDLDYLLSRYSERKQHALARKEDRAPA